jgi:serine/threonine-protein kinase HipA
MRELEILLGGRYAGTLTQDRNGAVRFKYELEYASDPDATPLSISMPLSVREHQGRVVLAWMSNLLPDNERVLQRWGQEFHVSASSPFRLLEHVGGDVAGAARLLRPEADEDDGSVEWLSDQDVAAVLAELALDPTAWTPRHALGHFSLAGAQAKTALRWDGKRWGRPTGSQATTHILKPSASALEHQALNEHLCLAAARLAGLTAAVTRVQNFGGTTAIVVQRYDRVARDGHVLRVHQEDFCQALGIMPAKKYQHDDGPSVADISGLIRRVTTAAQTELQVERFVSALAFSWVIAGTDAHAKNYSLLLSGPQVRLAPIYDVHSVLPYLAGEVRGLEPGQVSVHRAQLAMRIGSKYGINDVERQDWHQLADEVGMERETVLTIVSDLAAQVPAAFARVAADERAAGLLDPAQFDFADQLASLVAKRARECTNVLGGRPAFGSSRGR